MVWKGGRGENGGEEPRAPDCRRRSTRRSGSPPGSRSGIAPVRARRCSTPPRMSAAAATAPTIFLALVDAFAAPMCAWNLRDACGFFCISVSDSAAGIGIAEMVDILLNLLQRDLRDGIACNYMGGALVIDRM